MPFTIYGVGIVGIFSAILFWIPCGPISAMAAQTAKPEARAAETPDPAAPRALSPAETEVLAFYKSGKFFVPKSYKELRSLYAKQFAVEHAADIHAAFGDDYSEMMRWLDLYIDLKEELFLAIDPSRDNVVEALKMFHYLAKNFRDRFPAYGELAIAMSVVWDNGKNVYDHTGHQRRTKSTLPKDQAGAVRNFTYLIESEPQMEGRIRYMPWEFLAHVVNHRTPIEERKWAQENYLMKRANIGKCYFDIKYDQGMIEGKPAHLAGQVYSLEDIRRYGGVCAMQADFASRVARSIGVPAVYVNGASKSGDHHAWVMWVELLSVSPTKILFELKSEGRYLGHKYYVGGFPDPLTGRRTTDRQLELRLHNVGINPQNKRHADLVMKSFSLVRDHTGMTVDQQIIFLQKVMQLSPGNEQAWLTLANMTKKGIVNKTHARRMMPILNQLFVTFANFPDFTWTVFDGLIAFRDTPPQKYPFYERLVNLYVQAGRPDLACLAVLKYADYLSSDGKDKQAISALAMTINAFPDEGRYVPKMLDALEKICPTVKGANKDLIEFYQVYLPKIMPKPGAKATKYAHQMCRRAIGFFDKAECPEQAAYWRAVLKNMVVKP